MQIPVPRGYELLVLGENQVLLCKRCFCVTIYAKKHADWHKELEKK